MTKTAFVEHAKARPGTYAAQLMGDIYDDIFCYCRELKSEYQKYYAKEYLTFSAFVENFGYLPSEFLDETDRYYSRYKQIIHFASYSQILSDEEGLNLLARLLKLKIKSQ